MAHCPWKGAEAAGSLGCGGCGDGAAVDTDTWFILDTTSSTEPAEAVGSSRTADGAGAGGAGGGGGGGGTELASGCN